MIITGVYAGGSLRFVGDVDRGSACGCTCMVCGAQLVAKQGSEVEWHFAHAAGTESLSCRAGMLNLLRRLAVEELGKTGLWISTPYEVAHPIPGRPPLGWTASPTGPLTVADADGPDEPSAWVPLEGPLTGVVHVCVDNESPPAVDPASSTAVAIAWCPGLEGSGVRTEEDVRRFVRDRLRLRWAFLPDITGKVAAAEQEALKWHQDQRDAAARAAADQAREAGRRWALRRQQLNAAGRADSSSDEGPSQWHPSSSEAPLELQRPCNAPEWAPGLIAGGSIHYRELDDGSRWVCYPSGPGEWRLAPVPAAHDGWDETFPLSIAVPGGDRWLLVADFSRLLMLFTRHAVASRISTDLLDIERAFRR